MYIMVYTHYYINDWFIMTTHYRELKNFVNNIHNNSNITRKSIGKILLLLFLIYVIIVINIMII